MKKYFLLVLTILIVNVACTQNISKINIEDFRLSDEATSVALLNIQKQGDRYFDGRNILNQTKVKMYILGWSKDGKLAYLEDRFIDGRGGNDLYGKIIDLVTDEVVWDYSVCCYDQPEEGPALSFAECIKKNAKQINQALRESSIIIKPTNFQYLPIKLSEKNLSDIIEVKVDVWNQGEDMYGFLCLTYNIEAIKNGDLKQIITSAQDKMMNMIVPTGYLKSPYENRVALIIANSKFVNEGSEMFVEFFGCDLDTGFKK